MRRMQVQRGTSESTVADRQLEIGNRKLAIVNGFTLVELPVVRQCKRKAFTLIELIVVIVLIMLIAATALPTISGLFNAGADEQAYNIISAQIGAARALAIVDGVYAGLHVQIADRLDMENTCFAAVVVDPDANGTFALAPGFNPQQMPGNIAFGELSNTFVDSSGEYQGLANLGDFTSFTIVFSPAGEVVNNVNGSNISFNDPNLFKSGTIGDTDPQLWNPLGNENGVSAITLFDYKTLKSLSGATARENYLNENGQFMALNIYTGQFFYRY